MIVFALLLAAPAEDLQARLRHLEGAGAAWAPAPSPDGQRVAFLTTLFGRKVQAASVAVQGSYPIQLTDEPSGTADAQYLPPEAKRLVVTALREGRRRLLLVDDEGGAAEPVDGDDGDQLLGGVTRDGKRIVYAVESRGKASLRTYSVEAGKTTEVTPPPPAAGHPPPTGSLPLEEALSGLFALGPLSPDGRSVLALVRRGESDAIALADLTSARGDLIAVSEMPARFRQPRFSPDGRTVYVLTDAGRARMGVDAITVKDRSHRTVYAPDQEIDAFALSDDGHRLAVAVDANGQDVFSLLDFPTLRAQPLAAPPSGALAEGGMRWDRAGERLFFGWRLADDTTDVWELRVGRGTAARITRSPRPGLSPETIPRPSLLKVGDLQAWLWRPKQGSRPRVAVLIARQPTRPVFDKRIAALNFAGLAVLAVNGRGAQKAALAWLASAKDLDPREPLLLNPDGLEVADRPKWIGVVTDPGVPGPGLELDPHHPDLGALVRYARAPEQ
jgi:dipeptidyl aminopeptidase/acylaminoacyl peptidase